MRIVSLVAVLGLVATVHSVAVPATYVVHEKRNAASSKWIKRAKLDPAAILPMRICLKQQNLEKAHEYLMDVSHPDSKNYAKHWTPEEVIATFAPDQNTVDNVKSWLVDFGIAHERITHSDNKGWLAFDATTQEAESLLHTEYHGYEHSSIGVVSPACDSYHVPKHIQEHIDYITPGIKLLAPPRKRMTKRALGLTRPANLPVNKSNLSTCDIAITPACISALYQVPEAGPYVNSRNSLGIYEEGDYYAQKDLDLFFANFTPRIPQGTHPIPALIDGAEAPVPLKNAGIESDLDFQLAYPLIWPQTITLYQTDDLYYANETNGGIFNTFLDAIDGSYCTYSAFGEEGNDPNLDPQYPDPQPNGYKGSLQCGIYKPTNIISVSYGGQEYDLPAYYQERQCNEFLKLGLQGHSIFYASGDDGVAGPHQDDSANGCLGPDATIFSPAFPNSCPWITNVGATKVLPGRTVFEPESAPVDYIPRYNSNYSSGGGFSNIYSQPWYQQAAVASFFKNHNPPYPFYKGNQSFGAKGGLYNRIGRGYPDVAANGDNTAVYNEGILKLSGGTSASTPIFAAIINRINEERLGVGKRPVGFVNPALYANPWALNDITNGTNPGCETNGFSAVPGWDPVTGLGTPNYPKLCELFLSLP